MILTGETMRERNIVAVHAGNDRRVADFSAAVQGGCYAAALVGHYPNAGITWQFADRAVAAAVIDNDEFKVGKCLCQDAVDGISEQCSAVPRRQQH